MRRRWTSFDSATTNSELLRVPHPDRRALTDSMVRYRDDEAGGFAVKSYGGGLLMIKASNRTNGRCLFFTIVEDGENERLVALMFYKKESNEAPAHLVETARRRRSRYLESE